MSGIPFAIIRELCEAAGIDPTHVTNIRITPAAAYFSYFTIIEKDLEIESRTVRVCDCKTCLTEPTNGDPT